MEHRGGAEALDMHGILNFCSWEQRAAAAMVSKEWRCMLGLPTAGDDASSDGAYHWRYLCDRLSDEHNIHFPVPRDGSGSLPPPGIAASWQCLFKELFPARQRMDGATVKAGLQSLEGEDAQTKDIFEEKEEHRFCIK